MSRDEEYTEIACRFRCRTAKAVLVEIDGDEHWLPLSTLDDPEACDELEPGVEVTLAVADWKLYDLGL